MVCPSCGTDNREGRKFCSECGQPTKAPSPDHAVAATDWHAVWERKGSVEVGSYDHATLIDLDGFDHGAGRLDSAAFLTLAETARERLGLRAGMSLLEVGCGAGAFLWGLRGTGIRLYGVDYSSSLIRHARAAISEGTFAVSEAVALPFQADAIVSFSVFQYFPDYDYARRVLSEFARAAPRALVLDVPDIATREASEHARAALGSRPGLHLYYPRSFFDGAQVWATEIPGYANAPFRFDALLDHETMLRASGSTGVPP